MEKPSFEEAFNRLQEIVKRLEAGELALQSSLDLFEEGIGLYNQCQSELKSAEGRIEQLMKTLEGALKAEPFEV
ncbi:MAG: exodeoxyribonuclease VII small subunit [Solirubrobacterales bacterium]